MVAEVHGIHHVTCIAGDPQENLNFYVATMGLRLVKKSVNQDDPGTYHFFFADAVGNPGTDLTFFPWPGMAPAEMGVGLTVEVQFAVPEDSLPYWQERLQNFDVELDPIETRFDKQVLPFQDPHGLRLALVATDADRPFAAWSDSPVPEEHQLRGMHSVRLWERDLSQTKTLLTRQMGFELLGAEEGWQRFGLDGGGPGRFIEVKELPDKARGQWGIGGVHHVAWRVTDGEKQMNLRTEIAKVGLRPTLQIDRFWFKSVYFREPGGVLFELATDGPGFQVDEEMEALDEKLVLPPWLEDRRSEIEESLPAIDMPRTRA